MASLTDVPGGPTKAEIKSFSQPPPGAGVSGKYLTANVPADAKENEFPIVPFAPDKYDTLASIKQAVGDNENRAFGKKWVVPFTDADAQYMLRQEAQAKNANYEKWLWTQYDVTDPAQSWIFQQIAPEQFEKRKKLILYQQNLATKYALLRLYGVKTEEDLMLKYLVETNQVELPKGPIWDPKKWMQHQYGLDTPEAMAGAGGTNAWLNRYRAGMFSPLNYPTQNQLGHQPNPDNRADALSWARQKTEFQLFKGSAVANRDGPQTFYGQYPGWAAATVYRDDTMGIGGN